MNCKWNRRGLLTTVFAISFTTLFTAAAQAQDVTGSFTLPHSACWGMLRLPAGNYTFNTVSSDMPFILAVHGEGGSAFVMSQARSIVKGNRSFLQITEKNNQAVISSLQLAPYGLAFSYRSKHCPAEEEETAANRTPAKTKASAAVAEAALIEVPVRMSGR